ncbi:MAG: endopeptidase La, partial [Candidatus Electrothrix sp. AR4]|nr:endopeptidase La [Candidatus Electrothrix sp. AR4]
MDDQSQANKKSTPKDPTLLPIPKILPILPLHGFVFFPGMGFPLQIASSTSKQLVDEAMQGDQMIGLVLCHKKQVADNDTISSDDLHRVGAVGYIHKVSKTEEGYYQVLVSGVHKLSVDNYTQELPYIQAEISILPMQVNEGDRETEALLLGIRSEFKNLGEMIDLPAEIIATMDAVTDPYHVGYLVTSQLSLRVNKEQEILEIVEVNLMLHRVARELNRRLNTAKMSNKLQEDIKKDIDSKQREFFLRQQMQAIRKELGEDSDEKVELQELRERADEAGLSEEAQSAVNKELTRLDRISPSSPEYSVSRNYIDWILDLPWSKSTEDALDLDKAEEDLEQDHYGLHKVKKRILEFLAVRKLKNDIHGPILCLAGPPGVGKTSLGPSLAR